MAIKLTFVGDIMCDNKMADDIALYRAPNLHEFDFSSCFEHVREVFAESDYVLANLETPISRDDADLTNRMWTFCSPYGFAEAVKKSGIDFVSTANNHCLDRGLNGVKSTIDSLNSIGLAHCGIQTNNKNSFHIATVGKCKIGILAYTYGTNAFSNHCYLPIRNLKSVNLLQEQEGRVREAFKHAFHGHGMRFIDKAERVLYPDNVSKRVYEKRTAHFYRKQLIINDIRTIKEENVDYLIACLHIGGQYNEKPSDFTINVSNWFLKHGCDLVVDNHEHVVHGVRNYNNGFVAYALGNFLGSAGVTEAPFDRYSEYSIGLHVYLDEQPVRVKKVSFSVFKTVVTEAGRLEVWPVLRLADELNLEKDKNKLIKESLAVAKVFSGKEYESIQSEYEISSF